ncbi:hypothetical protein AB1286_23835 [Trinickia sp. NRRL B-1857]
MSFIDMLAPFVSMFAIFAEMAFAANATPIPGSLAVIAAPAFAIAA